ncbi:MAG: cysteine--1-D-myo-inosityl 2-amino-2-deoxy-alpha-D-glucopyranoside ligase [Propioniciclava sp.]
MQAWPRPEIPRLRPEPQRPQVHDTASGALRDVGPDSGTRTPARLYVCGITPYDATHLGHANTYVAFDLLHRVWLAAGLEVTYTQNVTDVDDPLLERASVTGVDWRDLAEDQTELFRSDMVALRVIPPQHYVGAVESIPLVNGLIERLRTAGLIYPVDDAEYPDWYFATQQVDSFDEVAHVDRTAALEIFGERGGDPARPGKRDPLDCLVWRLARDGEPAWDSPLGRGRPGWHIECTAIALEHLGPDFDVQGGGSDLVFPHHEMCAEGARAVTGEPMADAYVHAGMVGYAGEKMSKSKGNLVLVSRLREAGHDPLAIRLALLGHHYRSDWEYTDADLQRAETRLSCWRAAVRSAPAGASAAAARVRAALRADLDAPSALAAVDAWAAGTGTSSAAEVAELVATLDGVLGIDL